MAQHKEQPAAAATADPQLGAYEANRARNIERNNARLREMGLISAQGEQEANQVAWRRSSGPEKRRRKPPAKKKPTAPPARTSRRLKGLQAESKGVSPSSIDFSTSPRKAPQKTAASPPRYLVIAPQESFDDDDYRNAYAHCWNRVRTMGIPALRRRVQVIERAAGRHCILKMTVFRECLRQRSTEGEDWGELAVLADEALNRLKRLR